MNQTVASIDRNKLSTSLIARKQSNVLRTLALVCGVAFFSACNGNDTVSNSNAPVISAPPSTSVPMPPVNNKSLTAMGWSSADGKRTKFSDFSGKVLVLDFYATWCEPCRRSIPHLIGLQKQYQNDVSVIGLNVGGPEDVEEVPAFAEQYQIKYQLGVPDDDLMSFLLSGSDAIPQTFVFDRNGKLVKHFVGYGEDTGEQIDQAVESALKPSAN